MTDHHEHVSVVSRAITSLAIACSLSLAVALDASAQASPIDTASAGEVTSAGSNGEPATAESAEYRALIDEAVVEYQAQRFLEARALFVRAHALYPNARAQRGIGICAFELREYTQAHRALEAALSIPERPLTDTQREEVTELLARTARFLGFVRVDVPAGTPAEVSLDGAPAEPGEDGAFVLSIGRHALVVTADGHERLERTVEIVGGESIRLTPLPAAVIAPTQPAPPDVPVSDPTVPIVLLATGGAVALASIGIGAFAWPGRDAELARCEAAGIACDNADSLRGERDAAIGLTVGLGAAAGALLVVGAVLLVEGSSGNATTSVACSGGPLSGSCRVRF